MNAYQQTETWLNDVVIGLNLCPFAKSPLQHQRIKIVVTEAENEMDILAKLKSELNQIDSAPREQLETTLLVLSHGLQDFFDYNNFLDRVDALLEQNDWLGVFQIATFHPDYQFAGTTADDPSNLTNRSPFPILHILREDSLSEAVRGTEQADAIVARNIKTVNSLSEVNKAQLFPYIFKL